MCGKPGTGKNHLAFSIAKYVIQQYMASVVFTSVLHLTRKFKATWAKSSEHREEDIFSFFSAPDLLIIDEVGVQFGSEAEKIILFDVINYRYEAMKPTILISNLVKEELSKFAGERVLDRMNEGGGCMLAFTWESYRSVA